MDDLALARAAGPLAVVAGALLVLTDLARLFGGRDVAAFAADPWTLVANAGYAVSFAVLAVALGAVYLHGARATGGLGLAAFVVALVGTVEFGGNMWFDGFAAPWVAAVAPGGFGAARTTVLGVGAGVAPYGAPVGLTFVALGLWLSRRRSPATPPRAAHAR